VSTSLSDAGVGVKNQKFFLLSIFYCLLSNITFTSLLIACMIQLPHDTRSWCILGVALSCSISELGSMIFMYQLQLPFVLRNRTNIEHVCCKAVHSYCNYDRGTWNNLQSALGPLLLWFVPTTYGLDTVGLFYEPTMQDSSQHHTQFEI
jgi:hypothetical protein